MKRVLFIGDPHVVPSELDDCEALMTFVERVERDTKPDKTCVLGDLHHTHGIIRAEVMAFWRRWARGRTLMVGNHDFSGEGSSIHALMAYEDIATIIDRPTMDCGVLYMPYYSDREKFLADASAGGGRTLVAHQTFAGSVYENGFYAEDGVNPDLVPQTEILSGHIHSPQTFGKVTYIGAPRWRSLSDANTARAIWLYVFDDAGNVVEKTPFDTGAVCRQIRYVEVTPETPFDVIPDPNVDWRIDIRGPADFVQAQKEALQIPGAKVRTFKTDTKKIVVRESEGISAALRSFLNKYTPRYGTSTETLSTMIRERLGS